VREKTEILKGKKWEAGGAHEGKTGRNCHGSNYLSGVLGFVSCTEMFWDLYFRTHNMHRFS